MKLCRLLNYACQAQITLPTAESLLNSEITWLKKVRVSFSVTITDSAVVKNFVSIDRIVFVLFLNLL